MTLLNPHVALAPDAREAGVAVDRLPRPLPAPVTIPELSSDPVVVRRSRGVHRGRGAAWVFAAVDVLAAMAAVVLLDRQAAGLPTALAVTTPLLWPLALLASRSYDGLRSPRRLLDIAGRGLRAGAWFALGCVAVAAVTGILPDPALLLLLAAGLAAGSMAPRVGDDLWSRRLRRRLPPTRVVIAGHHPREVSNLVSELREHSTQTHDVAMVCLTRPPKHAVYDVPVAVGLDRLAEHATEAGATAVIVLPCHHLQGEYLRRLSWELEATRTALYVGTALLNVAPGRTRLAHAGGLGLLHVRPSRHRGPARALKASVERVLAVVALVALLPVLGLLAAAIRLDSSGPALYRQTRIGRGGTAFTMYKFRTMSVDADLATDGLASQNIADDVLFKIPQDPRVTRFGAVLRRYSVDELPQLANVVLGQMALVGPRPALPEEVERYSHDARRRLAVRPGMTGLWQVSGRSDLSWDHSVRIDLRYVDNWSLGLDLLILWRTAPAVLDHRGAY